jgi:hypothetical protein
MAISDTLRAQGLTTKSARTAALPEWFALRRPLRTPRAPSWHPAIRVSGAALKSGQHGPLVVLIEGHPAWCRQR